MSNKVVDVSKLTNGQEKNAFGLNMYAKQIL